MQYARNQSRRLTLGKAVWTEHPSGEGKRVCPSTRSNSAMKPTTKLDPALKGWLDNVIIPALLQEYLRQLPSENQKNLALPLKRGVVSVSEILERKEAVE